MKYTIKKETKPNLLTFGKYKAFRAKKHIRGVRLHFLPASNDGTQELYDNITFEKE